MTESHAPENRTQEQDAWWMHLRFTDLPQESQSFLSLLGTFFFLLSVTLVAGEVCKCVWRGQNVGQLFSSCLLQSLRQTATATSGFVSRSVARLQSCTRPCRRSRRQAPEAQAEATATQRISEASRTQLRGSPGAPRAAAPLRGGDAEAGSAGCGAGIWECSSLSTPLLPAGARGGSSSSSNGARCASEDEALRIPRPYTLPAQTCAAVEDWPAYLDNWNIWSCVEWLWEPDVKGHTGSEAYILFLRTCRDMFLVLSFASLVLMAPIWGTAPFFAGVSGKHACLLILNSNATSMPEEGAQQRSMNVHGMLFLMTILYVLIYLVFTIRFEVELTAICSRFETCKERKSLIERTIWISRLPIKDHDRFKLTDEHLQVVGSDLRGALEEIMRENCTKDTTQGSRQEEEWFVAKAHGHLVEGARIDQLSRGWALIPPEQRGTSGSCMIVACDASNDLTAGESQTTGQLAGEALAPSSEEALNVPREESASAGQASCATTNGDTSKLLKSGEWQAPGHAESEALAPASEEAIIVPKESAASGQASDATPLRASEVPTPTEAEKSVVACAAPESDFLVSTAAGSEESEATVAQPLPSDVPNTSRESHATVRQSETATPSVGTVLTAGTHDTGGRASGRGRAGLGDSIQGADRGDSRARGRGSGAARNRIPLRTSQSPPLATAIRAWSTSPPPATSSLKHMSRKTSPVVKAGSTSPRFAELDTIRGRGSAEVSKQGRDLDGGRDVIHVGGRGSPPADRRSPGTNASRVGVVRGSPGAARRGPDLTVSKVRETGGLSVGRGSLGAGKRQHDLNGSRVTGANGRGSLAADKRVPNTDSSTGVRVQGYEANEQSSAEADTQAPHLCRVSEAVPPTSEVLTHQGRMEAEDRTVQMAEDAVATSAGGLVPQPEHQAGGIPLKEQQQLQQQPALALQTQTQTQPPTPQPQMQPQPQQLELQPQTQTQTQPQPQPQPQTQPQTQEQEQQQRVEESGETERQASTMDRQRSLLLHKNNFNYLEDKGLWKTSEGIVFVEKKKQNRRPVRIEDVLVAPVIYKLKDVSTKRRRAEERAVHYEHLARKAEERERAYIVQRERYLPEPDRQPRSFWSKLLRLLRCIQKSSDPYRKLSCILDMFDPYRESWRLRKKAMYHRNQADKWRTEQLKMTIGKKELAGHAFVTLHNAADVQLLMQTMPACYKVWEWYPWWKHRSTISFGRAPFSAVILQCARAPEPSDINWHNLHLSSRRSSFWFGSLTGFLGLMVFVLSAFVSVAGNFVAIVAWLRTNTDRAWMFLEQHNLKWLSGLMHWLENMETKWVNLSSTFTALALLTINSIVVPYGVYYIALYAGFQLKSLEERYQLDVNFWFMLITSVALPLLGLTSIPALFAYVGVQESMVSGLERVEENMCHGTGLTLMQYLFSAAFLTNSFQLLKVPCFSIFMNICFRYATAASDRRECQEPLLQSWGFYYAFQLINVLLGIFISVLVPGTFSAAALYFSICHALNRYILNRFLGVGPDSKDTFASYAVRMMRYFACLWLSIMALTLGWGCHSLEKGPALSRCPAWLNPWGCLVLCVMAVLVFSYTHLAAVRYKGKINFKRSESEANIHQSPPRRRGAGSTFSTMENDAEDDSNKPRFCYNASMAVDKDRSIEEVLERLKKDETHRGVIEAKIGKQESVGSILRELRTKDLEKAEKELQAETKARVSSQPQSVAEELVVQHVQRSASEELPQRRKSSANA
eukprot:TRINITY_DN10545_c0_g1_i1.p1 TRINITY_DN10545_c0_g1~~TRINITY_DN10545_c0_g1_i1.p1  ORF type:complete len:1724 (-),score=302.97 TRINITY_DN10545_c0_g1_i1:266-5437(-)